MITDNRYYTFSFLKKLFFVKMFHFRVGNIVYLEIP